MRQFDDNNSKARNPLTLETNIMDSWQMVKERKTTKTSDITSSKAFYCEGGKNWHKALNVSRCLRAGPVSRCLSSDKKINFDVGATMQIYVRATQFAEQTVRVLNSMPRHRTQEAGCQQSASQIQSGLDVKWFTLGQSNLDFLGIPTQDSGLVFAKKLTKVYFHQFLHCSS